MKTLKIARPRAMAGGLGFVAVVVIGIALLLGLPYVFSTFGLLQMTVFAAMAIFALSQGFIWGFGGILCFGQSAFLGLGGYAYAVAALNMTDTTGAIVLAILVPMVFAAGLGYFMFYGRISDAYIGVITLTVTIILFNLINSTSGDIYHIGAAPLGGFNGIPSVPPINIPGNPDNQLDPTGLWYAAMGALILCYILLKWILNTRFGRVVVAIRENETRSQLLGYDPRLFKLMTFVIGAGIAGLAGCLYTNWGAFISPTVFNLTMSAQVIIYVLVGGLGTLIGPILGAIGIQYLIVLAGGQHVIDPNLLLGVVLVAFVLLVPQGVVPVIRAGFIRLGFRRGPQNGSGHGDGGRSAAFQRPAGAGTMSVPLLEAENVTMRFGGVSAVADVNFVLSEVELRCLIGPNGAGKSTFFKILTGQLRPTEGVIRFRGQDITGAHPHVIARLGVGIKTQVPNVFNGLTVREGIGIAAGRKKSMKRARQIVEETMELLQLTPIADMMVGQLAHGQRQWVEIATVLAQEPDLILLDEPAAGMTHDEVLRTSELIRMINKKQALVVVEHDMQFIRMIAKTVTVFNRGRILIENTVDAVLADPEVRDVYLGKQTH